MSFKENAKEKLSAAKGTLSEVFNGNYLRKRKPLRMGLEAGFCAAFAALAVVTTPLAAVCAIGWGGMAALDALEVRKERAAKKNNPGL